MKKMSRTQTVNQALETAYWMHWCGNQDAARKLLIRITDFVVNEENDGKRKQKISLW